MYMMLWVDDSKLSLEEKVTKAVDYYNRKYGDCNTCFVSMKNITEPTEMNGIRLIPDILPNYHLALCFI